jgi:hypothetical protein
VIILGKTMSHRFPTNLMSVTYQIIQQFCLSVELVDESRKAERSLPAKVDQRIKF